jgi:hypothetical protein
MAVQKLRSPGSTSFESEPSVSNIRGADVGTGWMLGIAEWGQVAVPTECVSYPDFERKFGGYLSGYYLAKSAWLFFKNGGKRLFVVRTAHYDAGALQALKADTTIQGLNAGIEDRTKVDTISFEAMGEGTRGNKINVSNKKFGTILSAAISPGAASSATVVSASGLEIGDIVDIYDDTHWVRVILTNISFQFMLQELFWPRTWLQMLQV